VAEDKVTRKLTTILAADVEGYTRLMRADEEATLKTLGEYRDVIDGLIARHEGRVFSTGGDSVLAEFGSAVEAVRCAISCQEEISNRNAELADDRKLMFRIGINIGDVMVRDGDLFGDGVNVAARLEGLAEAGGICISGSVFEQIKHKLSHGFEDMGSQEVKNIAEPISAYRLVLGQVSVSAGATAAAQPSGTRRWRMPAIAVAVAVLVAIVGGALWWQPWSSDVDPASVAAIPLAARNKAPLAILPFKNLTEDPAQEHFADGLTEDIITDFAKFPMLFVIAGDTVFTYKGKSVRALDIGRELGVRYVLEGSVQKIGEKIRITGQLIDATNEERLWAERYDGSLADKFAVRDEARWSIIANLFGEFGVLMKAEHKRAIEKTPESRGAYDYFQLGFDLMSKYTKEANAEARRMFETAVELDPEYSRAHNGLGWSHYRDANTGWSEDYQKSVDLAFDSARRAWELDPSDYWSHWLLGLVYIEQGQHDKAVAAYEQAGRLNPLDADLLADSGWPLVVIGRSEEAITHIERAMDLKPNFPEWYLWTLGIAYREAGQYEQAITTFKKMTDPDPKVWLHLASAYVRLGRIEEARSEVTAYRERYPDRGMQEITQLFANAYKDRAQVERFLDDISTAGMPK
jgi:TolB-like protein/class 3 adenylate cyclase